MKHLFFEGDYIIQVWEAIFQKLGWLFILSSNWVGLFLKWKDNYPKKFKIILPFKGFGHIFLIFCEGRFRL